MILKESNNWEIPKKFKDASSVITSFSPIFDSTKVPPVHCPQVPNKFSPPTITARRQYRNK